MRKLRKSLAREFQDGQYFTPWNEPSNELNSPAPVLKETRPIPVTLQDVQGLLYWRYQAKRSWFKTRLLKIQKDKCTACGEQLIINEEVMHIHHIRPVSWWAKEVFDNHISLEIASTACNNLKNLQLMHALCHQRLEGKVPVNQDFIPINSPRFKQEDGFIFHVSD